MALAPSRTDDLHLRGSLRFRAQFGGIEIDDSYRLWIEIPGNFPRGRPRVWELDQKVPKDGNHHLNPDDTLCLGSPLHVLMKISSHPTLIGFARECLVPFLYAVSRKRTEGGSFFMGELPHGEPGIIIDYQRLLGLKSKDQVVAALRLTGMKKRHANKKPCACGCGLRLGSCSLRLTINRLRSIMPRAWYRAHLSTLGQVA